MNIKKKLLCVVLVLCILCMGFAGCAGKYALFNKLAGGVNHLSNKWVNSLVNLVFWIVPVYGICLLGDIIIFNTIEFWTGSNALAMGETYEATDEAGNYITAVKNEDGTLSVKIVDVSGNTAEFVMQNDGDQVRIIDSNSKFVFSNTIGTNNVSVTDGNGFTTELSMQKDTNILDTDGGIVPLPSLAFR